MSPRGRSAGRRRHCCATSNRTSGGCISCAKILIESAETRKGEDFVQRIYGFWWEFPDPKPEPEILPILQRLPELPPLTQNTAREWSRKVIVPLIMLEDAGTPETCETPALRNIWRHRSVKSRATFQSRLHSAVTDTLQRFGRPG